MERFLEVGYRNQHPKFGWYEVINKVDSQRFVVKFDNTGTTKIAYKCHILRRNVCDTNNDYFYNIGDCFENKYGKYKIVELLPKGRCLIKWDNFKELCNVTKHNAKIGKVKPKEEKKRMKSFYTKQETKNKTKIDGKNTKLFEVWRAIKKRCGKQVNYLDCQICNEWEFDYQAFAEWAKTKYKEGWQIDKDILLKGNRIYSPQTCCFVPQHINSIFTNGKKKRGEYPIGVYYSKKDNLYQSRISEYGHWVYLGCYRDPISAFNAYKKEKERYIKEVANKWKDQLEPKVYNALMKYEVEITD